MAASGAVIALVGPTAGFAQESTGSGAKGVSGMTTGVGSTGKGTTDPLADLRKEQGRLALEGAINELKQRTQLAPLAAEKARLELEAAIARLKLEVRLAAIQTEIEELTRKGTLLQRRALAQDLERKALLDTELAETRIKFERAKLANDLAMQLAAGKARETMQRQQEMQLHLAELNFKKAQLDHRLAKLNTEISLRERRDVWKNRVNADINYTNEPFKDGTLTISDRRIALNGPIGMDTADHIADRIDYFNNQNREHPIFIVIDRSPGGSVMAGFKILKAMHGSVAPVYVVVKSFAASMAAGITTLAKRSFAYPNAIILHHQVLSMAWGNLTVQKEQLRDLEEWWRRLAKPVAKKMGIGLDDFIKEMYKHRSTGDWIEWGDRARKLKWVDDLVETIREESYDKNPDTLPVVLPPRRHPFFAERVDTNGRRYVELPRLDPVDGYYLFNPDNYYRLAR